LWIRASDIGAPRLVIAPAIGPEEDDRGGWGKSSATEVGALPTYIRS
jgi:hypothetical protein